MGTRFSIVIEAPPSQQVKAAARAAFDRIDELDRMMSSYRSESELRKLCRSAETASSMVVSADMCEVLLVADRIYRLSSGAFDVTVGPLVRLWRRAIERRRPPPDRGIAALMERIGADHLSIDPATREVKFSRPGIEIDLGGIAKGYALECAREILVDRGFNRCLIEGGGDIACSSPPSQPPWRIGLAPLSSEGSPSLFIEVEDGAVATSGDSFRYLDYQGRRYSHVIDPRSGWGVVGPSSVTVVAIDATVADALATALSVLGPIEGKALLEDLPGVGVAFFGPEIGASPVLLGSFPALKQREKRGRLELEATPRH